MSKRLQVLLSEQDMAIFKAMAKSQRLSLGEWVRRTLEAAASTPTKPLEDRLRVLERASKYDFPTGDIDQMLKEIEAGRAQDLH